MVRFRIGQSWKRERERAPQDAFGLELDGVDLLAGASEEPLDRVVEGVLAALKSLVAGEPFAEVALPEAHLELVLRRVDSDVQLEVVSLGRPARRLKGPVAVDLAELVEAAVRCAEGLLTDVREAAPALAPKIRRALSSRARALEHARWGEPRKGAAAGWERAHAASDPGFGFSLSDPNDRLGAFEGTGASLGSLLVGGKVWLEAAGEVIWTSPSTPPFLTALELARQGADLVHALELEDRAFACALGGGAKVEIDLGRGELRSGGKVARVPAHALARAMFEVGQALAVEVTARNRAQARNAWLEELVARCREGAAGLGSAIRPPEDERAARATPKRKVSERPLRAAGRVRRLRFEAVWQKQNVAPPEGARLLVGKGGVIVSSPSMAVGFTPKGELRFRHVGAHGAAVSPDGWTVVATLSRVAGHAPQAEGARWVRDHDGVPLGPELIRAEGLCVASAEGRGALAFSELTGRELWRLLPPRTQRAYLSVQAHRALVATDGGYLYGLDLRDGQVRFRMRWPLPFAAPTVPWGRKLVGVLGRGGRALVVAADAHSGALVWSRELGIAAPSRPVTAPGRVFVAGGSEDGAVLSCLGRSGELAWERRLQFGSTASLLSLKGTVVATSASGAAVSIGAGGAIDWRVGASGEELGAPLPARRARGVLIVPGEVTRAVDPRGGQVLAEVRTGIGLSALEIDARLNLYALDEDGTLTAYRLTTALSVL